MLTLAPRYPTPTTRAHDERRPAAPPAWALAYRALHLARLRGLGEIGFGPGQCPAIDSSVTMCKLPYLDQTVQCNLIRECDQYTGALHFEFALPYGSPNQNIWQISGSNAVWIGPAPAPTSTPVFPAYVADAITFDNTQTNDPNAYSVPLVTAAPTGGTTPTSTQLYTVTPTGAAVPAPSSDQPPPIYTPPSSGSGSGSGSTPPPADLWQTINAGAQKAAAAITAAAKNPSQAAEHLATVPWWFWAALAAGGYGVYRFGQRSY